MIFARSLLILGLGIAATHPALAQDQQAWIGASDCRLATVKPAPTQAPSWHGGCKDGYAVGKGVLEWQVKDGKTYRLEASFLAGQEQGEGVLHYPDGTVYTGTFSHNRPDGKGYVQYANGDQYEGDIRMEERDGVGEMLYANGDDYKGQWKHGNRDGTGAITYVMGGRYEGGWKDGEWSGQGKLVYAGGAGHTVTTVDGRDPNRAPAPAAGQNYALKEGLDHAHGTMIRRDIATNIPVPPHLSYQDLSPEQKAAVDSWWPALAPGDEPPYPLHGPANFLKAMSAIGSKFMVRGTTRVYALVGKDGKVVNVRAVGLDDPEARKLIAVAAGLIEYKPARCAGQPCEMVYPFNMRFTLE